MEENTIIHGFKLLKKDEVAEVASTAYTFEHVKSGARLFFLKNDDDNKVFSISFRTPPVDDTGVAHIVEHSTLCGSRKYPLKEPFVELVKGSLNTFLNAMTYPDKTMYPVASRNDKDFQNLMDVYLDAVFYPNMRTNPQVLMQEGWHYEIEKPEEPLRYSGVVYNEMKGALSSPDDLLESRIMHSLYPDTTYGHESGGDPEAIPDLTQEKFIAFHQKYYHPSNSYIYLYGDMDIEEKLAYLDDEYLSHFDRIPVPSKIDRQQEFGSLKRETVPYPVSADEGTEEKTFLTLNWTTGESLDPKTMMGLEILEHALLRTPAAPLRKALVDAKLGKDVDSIFENDMLQPFFSIIINNSEEDRLDKFYHLAMTKLQQLAENGIDRELLEASINLMEFRLREADFGSAPKGLIYGIRIMKSWLYGGDPETYLRYEDLLQQMKDGLTSRYFESLIEEYFLANPHRSLLAMVPDTELAARREQEQEEKLAKKKASLSKEEIESIIASTRALKERQQSPETEEALKTIPVLKLSDIRKKSYPLPLDVRELDGTKVLFSDVNTNGIAYLNLYFDVSSVTEEELPYLYLLSELIGMVDTKEHTYAELANLRNLHTGGMTSDVVVYTKKDEPGSMAPKLRIKAKALVKKLPELMALLKEIMTESQFTDEKRLQELIEQEEASIELNLQRSANQIIVSRLAAYLSKAGCYADEGGLPFYPFLKEFAEDFSGSLQKMQNVFKTLLPKVFNRQNLVLSITLQEKEYEAFTKAFAPLQQALSNEKFPAAAYDWDIKPLNEGLTSSSRVQYVGKAANFLRLGYHFTGSMAVLETLLRYDYFWTKIRVQGGAYGAFTGFNRNGFMYFGSYRDPNLKETLAVFDGTADYAANFEASEREMDKFIIGTMSGVDTPMTPMMKGDAAATCYLRGITEADRQQRRDEILATRQQDIRALAPLIDACMKENVLCVFGNDEKIAEAKDVFGAVKPAL